MAENEDGASIRNVIFDALKEHGLNPDVEITDRDLFDIESYYSGHFFGVLLDKDNQIVGTFALYTLSPEIAEIRKMYLTPSVRGKGLGRWMMQFLLKMAEEKAFKYIELETASCLKDAIVLYEKFGFKDVNPENKSPRCDRKMLLKLNSTL